VIVDDIDIYSSQISPSKDNAPLIVHPNAVKSAPSTLQCFQPVSGRRRKVSQFMRVLDHVQFAGNGASNIRPAEGALARPRTKNDSTSSLAKLRIATA